MFKYLLVVFVFWCQIHEYAADQTEQHNPGRGDTTKLLLLPQNNDTEIFDEKENAEKNMTRKSEVTMNGHMNYHVDIDKLIFYIYGEDQVKQLLSNIMSNDENGAFTINLTTTNKNNYNFNKQIPEDYTITRGIGAHKFHLNKMNWNKARRTCIQEGGHLAVINSDFEEDLLLKMLNEKDINWAWIGAHDLFEEGDWVTVTGESLESAGYSKWTTVFPTKEPNNYNSNQNCATLVKWGGMDDYFCSELRFFFCEIPV